MNKIFNQDFIILNRERNMKINLNEHMNYLILIKDNSEIEYNLDFVLKNNENVNLFIADISSQDLNCNIKLSFEKKQTKIYLYLATITEKKYKKNYQIHAFHDLKNTISDLHIYGVAKDESFINVTCKSEIKMGSIDSEAHQEIRLTLLDKTSQASSDPILIIDENEIMASHANAIGMLDKEQIFYLQSRGLSYDTAKNLIINGFFKPIIDTFGHNELNKIIISKLEGL